MNTTNYLSLNRLHFVYRLDGGRQFGNGYFMRSLVLCRELLYRGDYDFELGGEFNFFAKTPNTVDNHTAWRDMQRVMHLCGLGDSHHLVSEEQQNSPVNFSQSVLQALETLTSEMIPQGVLSGGLEKYGQKAKVKNILSTLGMVLESRHEASND